MNNFGDDIANEFIQDARDLVADAEKSLLAIDSGSPLSSHYNAIFRALHSIKGGSGMLGMSRLQQIVHHLETLLTKYKTQPNLPEKVTNYLLEGVDAVRAVLDQKPEAFEICDPEATAKSTLPVAGNEQLIVSINLDEGVLSPLKLLLEKINFRVTNLPDPKNLESFKNDKNVRAIVLNCTQKGAGAISILKALRQNNSETPVLISCQDISVQHCIEGLNLGTHCFIQWPLSAEILFANILNVTKMQKAFNMVNQCVNLLMYQYSDLDESLNRDGKQTIRSYLRDEMKNIMEQKNTLFNSKVS